MCSHPVNILLLGVFVSITFWNCPDGVVLFVFDLTDGVVLFVFDLTDGVVLFVFDLTDGVVLFVVDLTDGVGINVVSTMMKKVKNVNVTLRRMSLYTFLNLK
jgi:hypothetical protein